MSGETVGGRIVDEAKKALLLTVYFGFWFSALTLLTHEILEQHGLPYTHWGLAWIKAALCAKFILIGQAIYPMRFAKESDLWRIVLPRSLIYLLVVIFLNIMEECLDGMLHGMAFMDGVHRFASRDPVYIFAEAWVYWLILVPFLLMDALGLASIKKKCA